MHAACSRRSLSEAVQYRPILPVLLVVVVAIPIPVQITGAGVQVTAELMVAVARRLTCLLPLRPAAVALAPVVAVRDRPDHPQPPVPQVEGAQA